jgi:hypothetical protein
MNTIFRTQGLLELDALMVMGLSAKPASNSPIGMFGTGLKYAIAVLARNDIKVEIIIGTDRWVVEKQVSAFRNVIYDAIILKNLSNGEVKKLPFTTHLGVNWELWGALIELYCNTIDEQGVMYTTELVVPNLIDQTFIIVYGNEFSGLFNNRFTEGIFIEGKRHESSGVEIIDKPSNYIFYRGVRVMSLPHTSLFTYNILSPLRLTEDRTIPETEMYLIKSIITKEIRTSNDKNMLEKILNCGEDDWENCLSFPIDEYCVQNYSEEFKNVGAICSNETVSKNLYKSSPAYLQAKEERKQKAKEQHFLKTLLDCIEHEEWDKFKTVAEAHHAELVTILVNELDCVEGEE